MFSFFYDFKAVNTVIVSKVEDVLIDTLTAGQNGNSGWAANGGTSEDFAECLF